MIQIRGNTFETNSSSAHSLVILNNPYEQYTPEEARRELWIYLDKDGTYRPRENIYFGRYPFKVLRTFEEKLQYAYANAPTRVQVIKKTGKKIYSRRYHNITKVVNKFIPEFKRADFGGRHRGPDCDYGSLFHWLKKADMSLIDFLTNKQVIVICDGDEYCVWSDMKKMNIVNKDIIKKELF